MRNKTGIRFVSWLLLTSLLLGSGAVLAGCVDNEPPATEPPVTEPPATEPPATEPPATEPPATEPPATEPPATEPPATEPPATEPPVTEPPEEVIEDVFEYILDRYAYLEFGDGRYSDQKNQAKILKNINNDCKTWMDRVDRDCTTDPFGMKYAFTSANMSTIYKNILCMARGYATKGSTYYKNEQLRDDIIYCLDFMYDKYYGETRNKLPSGSNWHDSYINSPGSLTRILLALRDDLSIDAVHVFSQDCPIRGICVVSLQSGKLQCLVHGGWYAVRVCGQHRSI